MWREGSGKHLSVINLSVTLFFFREREAILGRLQLRFCEGFNLTTTLIAWYRKQRQSKWNSLVKCQQWKWYFRHINFIFLLNFRTISFFHSIFCAWVNRLDSACHQIEHAFKTSKLVKKIEMAVENWISQQIVNGSIRFCFCQKRKMREKKGMWIVRM